jgi:tRNA-dihydrouridine synthase
MSHPKTFGNYVSAMRLVVDVPETIKTRIGIDDFDQYEFLRDFDGAVAWRRAQAHCPASAGTVRRAILHH